MIKVAQRRKRVAEKRKIDIIEKEKTDLETKEEVKKREFILIETRYVNTVRNNFEKIRFKSEVEQWAHSGYSTSKNAKPRKFNLSASPDL